MRFVLSTMPFSPLRIIASGHSCKCITHYLSACLHRRLFRTRAAILVDRFEPKFLEERNLALRAFLTQALVKIPLTSSQSMLDFLEVRDRLFPPEIW